MAAVVIQPAQSETHWSVLVHALRGFIYELSVGARRIGRMVPPESFVADMAFWRSEHRNPAIYLMLR